MTIHHPSPIVGAVRWLLVLPGAIVAMILANILFAFGAMFALWFAPDVVERILSGYPVALFFVVVGAAIAPAYRFPTAIILAVMALALDALLLRNTFVDRESVIENVLASGTWVAGLMSGIGAIYDDDQKRRLEHLTT